MTQKMNKIPTAVEETHEKSQKNWENFEKTILFECSSEIEMNAKEAEIVNEDFIARDDVYNIELGRRHVSGVLHILVWICCLHFKGLVSFLLNLK